MNTPELLDDQPVESKQQDQLHFQRYVDAIKNHVFSRTSKAPFVVGIYGKWGSGKTSLLKMLKESLDSTETGGTNKWEIIEFSPWMYRYEKSLLLPLLATIAKKHSGFVNLIKEIIKSGPGLIKMLSEMGLEAATTGLPLLTFLKSVHQQQWEVKDLREKIEEAVKLVTSNGKRRLVFLIDDLDRCSDSAQIVSLLEQIKLFLYLEYCLFFICADRDQIITAIEKQFPGEGRHYLEKFVQLPLELSSHQSANLATIPMDQDRDSEIRPYLMEVSEILENNPRRLKQIWNQAIMGCEVIKKVMQGVTGFSHEASLKLMLKWLLIKEAKIFSDDPYRYLALQYDNSLKTEDFLKKLSIRKENGDWRSEFHRRLAVFLWYDRIINPFENSRILSLYVEASGEDTNRSRHYIETQLITGKTEFQYESFYNANLDGVKLSGVKFSHCDFRWANLKSVALDDVTFHCCKFDCANFYKAKIENVRWEWCHDLDNLAAEPEIYEAITDQAVNDWYRLRTQKLPENPYSLKLFKMYQIILEHSIPDHWIPKEAVQGWQKCIEKLSPESYSREQLLEELEEILKSYGDDSFQPRTKDQVLSAVKRLIDNRNRIREETNIWEEKNRKTQDQSQNNTLKS